MQEVLAEAKIAAKKGEVPVRAVLVHKKKIIARFHNQ
jgi:tRNA(Arg) A34 adenosine deaminase TadA